MCMFLCAGSIQHEDRAMSNVQALLHSAWLGDAVSVKKSLEVSGGVAMRSCDPVCGVPLCSVWEELS